jgi:hypothetical protein
MPPRHRRLQPTLQEQCNHFGSAHCLTSRTLQIQDLLIQLVGYLAFFGSQNILPGLIWHCLKDIFEWRQVEALA